MARPAARPSKATVRAGWLGAGISSSHSGASLNLLWICFDIRATCRCEPSLAAAQPLSLASVPSGVAAALAAEHTPLYDPIKGSNPHAKPSFQRTPFNELDSGPDAGLRGARSEGAPQVELAQEMIAEEPFLAFGRLGHLRRRSRTAYGTVA